MFQLVNNSTALTRVLAIQLEGQRDRPRIVVLGGGTGLSVLLRGLRQCCFPVGDFGACHNDRLTAIVTVADDGGSSGALRRSYHVPALGDIRNCMLALSDADPTLHALFNYRFDAQLRGHQLGNLMLTALTLMHGDFVTALGQVSDLLNVRDRVWPATTDDVRLAAEFADGTQIVGESRIAGVRRHIRCVRLLPADARALPQALEAIAQADLIVIGPGSLYTSLIPTLLVRGVARAIRESHSHVVLVMNLMTEPGETDGYAVADFIMALRQHAPGLPVHSVLINRTSISKALAAHYAAEGSAPVAADPCAIAALGCRSVQKDLLAQGVFIRHDPGKLARALLDMSQVAA